MVGAQKKGNKRENEKRASLSLFLLEPALGEVKGEGKGKEGVFTSFSPRSVTAPVEGMGRKEKRGLLSPQLPHGLRTGGEGRKKKRKEKSLSSSSSSSELRHFHEKREIKKKKECSSGRGVSR